MIETEMVLYGDNDPLEGCDLLVVADEDARLYELGSDLLKNSGCAKAHPVMVKRKDFIFTLNHCQGNRIVACGLIWSADLEEELMRVGERGGVVEVGRVSWYDEDSIYGRPALALMGPLGSDWRELLSDYCPKADIPLPTQSGISACEPAPLVASTRSDESSADRDPDYRRIIRRLPANCGRGRMLANAKLSAKRCVSEKP